MTIDEYERAQKTIAESKKAGIAMFKVMGWTAIVFAVTVKYGLDYKIGIVSLVISGSMVLTFLMGFPIIAILSAGGCGCGHPYCAVDNWNKLSDDEQEEHHRRFKLYKLTDNERKEFYRRVKGL